LTEEQKKRPPLIGYICDHKVSRSRTFVSGRREAVGGHYDLDQCAPELIDLVMTGAAGRPSPVYLQTKRPRRCGLLFYLSQSSSFGGPLMGRNAKKGEPVFTKRLCSCSNWRIVEVSN